MLLLGACGVGGSPARRGMRRRAAGRARTEGHLRDQGRQGGLPRPSVDRASDRDGAAVRNTGTQTVPNVAVTIDSFAYTSNYPDLSVNKRPIWVVEEGPGAIPKRPAESETVSPPGGGQTAYVNTWALGALAPGHTRTFVWRVVPVKAGLHIVHYTVAAGLTGKSPRAVCAAARARVGTSSCTSPPRRRRTHVDPETGQVVPGAYPAVAVASLAASSAPASAVPTAPRGRAWPAVERSSPGFRHAEMPIGTFALRFASALRLTQPSRLCARPARSPFPRRNRARPCHGPASRTSPPRSGAPTASRSARPT